MAECPFCGSEVTEDLVTFGGTCPKCFAEIPGEEAATDPGTEVVAAQETRERRWSTARRVAAYSMLLLIVSCTGLTAVATVMWPDPEVAAILDFDSLDFPMPDLVGVDTLDVAAAPTPKRSVKPPSDAAPRVRPDLAPPTTSGPKIDPSRSGSADLSLSAPVVRRDDNLVLEDAEAIRDMIGERMIEFIPGLNVCYDRRLKVAPSLKGRWRLKFTVATSGEVTAAEATGIDRPDAELERCLVDHIARSWRFGRITVNQPVQRTLRFEPS